MIHAIICSLVFTSGAGTSLSGPNRSEQIGGVAPRQALELAPRHLRRDRTATPPLPPPKGMFTTAHFQVIQAASAFDLVERDVGVIADAALGGPADDRVLHAVAREHLERAVVHHDRKRDDRGAARPLDELLDAAGQVEARSGLLELSFRVASGLSSFCRLTPTARILASRRPLGAPNDRPRARRSRLRTVPDLKRRQYRPAPRPWDKGRGPAGRVLAG